MEERIRKKWLISFFAITSITSVYAFFITPHFVKIFPLFAAALGGITYYCGYKKRGTSWLSLIITVRALGVITTLTQIIYFIFIKQLISFIEKTSDSTSLSPKTYLALWIGGIVISIYYTYWCYRLRKLNSQQKKVLT